MDSALKIKLGRCTQENRVTFADLHQSGGLPLKIVATDLTDRQLRMFSYEETPDVSVADAVTASICLPIIFELWELPLSSKNEPHQFFDGGLVSNLPAWPFDAERAVDPFAITVAVEIIESDGSNRKKISRAGWMGAAISTAAFGAGLLNKRAIGRLEVVALEPGNSVLDFDTPRIGMFKIVREAKKASDARIISRIIDNPRILTAAASAARKLVISRYHKYPTMIKEKKGGSRIRASIAVPDDQYNKTLRLRYCAGFEEDADEGIIIPVEGSFSGYAWKENTPFFQIVPFASDLCLPGPENDLRRRLIWKDMAWSFSIPISSPSRAGSGSPSMIVAIDGSDLLDETCSELQAFTDEVAYLIESNLKHAVVAL
ncbi:hypothetical protein FV232_27875 [Methylobacterium sp. WL30]|nr:patatin-like phospholipase family protein [Methylobacterium sp. WL30]TXN60767.1 hypothetical protein FV232_27875 [Methylobacterium sp. WL30]